MMEEDFSRKEEMAYQLAYPDKMYKDTMYFHQDIWQPDKENNFKAIVKEVNGHCKNKHWKMIPREAVPEG